MAQSLKGLTRPSAYFVVIVISLSVFNFQSSRNLLPAIDHVDNVRGAAKHTLEQLAGSPEIGSLSCPHPLVPIYDRTKSEIDLEPRKIPRIMHMTMKSRCLPPDLAAVTSAWKEALPYHAFYFHDDTAVARLFQLEWKEFPQLASMMRCVTFKGAMKIDVWRILVVYLFGGIYSDIDVPPGPSFNENSPIKVDDEAFFFSDAWGRPSQWFFAMEPKHPVGYYTVYEIFKRLQDLQTLEKPQVVFVTGPDALKHGYGNALGWPENLFEEGTHQSKKFNKTATKLKKTDTYTINPNIIDMGKIVPWNETQNVTVRERIERQSGVIHWTKQVYWRKAAFIGSCLDFLYTLDVVEAPVVVNLT
ncbi:hypothetical protein ACHAWX_000872 [Stephanocyclus meneghinianus]